MSTDRDITSIVRSWLDEGVTVLPDRVLDAVLDQVPTTPQRRPSWLARRLPIVNNPSVRYGIAAVAVIAAVILGLNVLQPDVGGPRPTPSPTPEATPIVWAPASADEPFPAPFREEPAGGAPDVDPIQVPAGFRDRQELAWNDPAGDGQPGDEPRVDIVRIEFSRPQGCLLARTLCLFYRPEELLHHPLPKPTSEWIAYGLVFDNDGDGRPDARFGIDNLPGDRGRAWYTDLVSGTTDVVKAPAADVSPDGFYGEIEFPYSRAYRSERGYMWLFRAFSSSPALPGGRFYLWAAVIREGRIMSVDFAPDVGWLVAP